MTWTVTFSPRAAKQKTKLPAGIAERLDALRIKIEATGPLQPKTPHFGKLNGWPGETYHCHLNKGRPTYVVIWQVEKDSVQVVEVIYAGTHEKAPY
jgi:mRNA-degrading endonuclease RelE of RelBE toxin-antitoxin system